MSGQIDIMNLLIKCTEKDTTSCYIPVKIRNLNSTHGVITNKPKLKDTLKINLCLYYKIVKVKKYKTCVRNYARLKKLMRHDKWKNHLALDHRMEKENSYKRHSLLEKLIQIMD